jgi:hypothetical protein
MGSSQPGKPASRGTCPICKAPTDHQYRPFCSRRCADVDLSRWLRGAYAIPLATADDDEDGDEPQGGLPRAEPVGRRNHEDE